MTIFKIRIATFFILLLAPILIHGQDRFTMALTGDSIITRKMSVYQEPQFLKMIELIRGADVGFTNIVSNFSDSNNYFDVLYEK